MNTFSYCGIDSSTFNCYYVPDEAVRFDDRADYDVYEDSSDWHEGGRYYGNNVKKREFTMDCFYEQIDRKTKQQMMSWLDRNTQGKLIFEQWPWKYYIVRPTKKLSGKEFMHRINGTDHDVFSGTFTITFTAYEPFAYIDESKLDSSAEEYLNLIKSNAKPTAPKLNSTSFNIYNYGTQRCYPIIRIGGTAGADGITISNKTNGTSCKILSLPTVSDSYLEIDCGKCLVSVVNGTTVTNDFSYHDLGYISIEPCEQIMPQVTVTYTTGSNVVTIDKEFSKQYLVGKYFLIGTKWMKVLDITDDGVVVNTSISGGSGAKKSRVYTLNEISISGTNRSLTKLEVEFIPRMY